MILSGKFDYRFILVYSMTSERMFNGKQRCGLTLTLEKVSCEPVDNFLRKITAENFPAVALPDIFQPCNEAHRSFGT